jgi:hypothetical protein
MKKAPWFIACSIALTVLFYMLAYYLLPPPAPTAGMVLLFAAIAMVIVWAVGVGIKKWRAGRAGSGAGQSSTGGHAVLAFLLLGALSPFAIRSVNTASVIAAEAAPTPQPPNESGNSIVCQFTAGPRAGTAMEYPVLSPVPIGSVCTDGAGSTGSVISTGKTATAEPPPYGQGAPPAEPVGGSPPPPTPPPPPPPSPPPPPASVDSATPDEPSPGFSHRTKPPRAGDGMPRITGTAILLPAQKEEPGYALYSYALMSHRPRAGELPKVKAYLTALLELPTAAAVERNVPRSRINITYLPLEAPAPLWEIMPTENQVDYVVAHYDYGRGAAMMSSLSQRTGAGPVIISLLKPLDVSAHPHPVLVQDLTSAEPSLMASYVAYFVDKAATDQFQKDGTLSNFGLTLRNGLEVAAMALGMSKDAVATWVKYFN